MSKLIKRKDGSYSPRGLWDNIRANIGSGKEPTKEMLAQEKKIKRKMEDGGSIPERYRNMGFSRVGQKKESTNEGKKWMVLAKKGDQYKVVHGGYKGMQDFKQHGSEQRKENFWNRMGGRDSAKATDPFSPLYWHKRLGTWQKGGKISHENDKEMVDGIADILKRVKDINNRGTIAKEMVNDFKKENVNYNLNDFLSKSNLPKGQDGLKTPDTKSWYQSLIENLNPFTWFDDEETPVPPATKSVTPAKKNNPITNELLLRQSVMESHHRKDVATGKKVSPKGARGLTQIMPNTLAEFLKKNKGPIDLNKPEDAVRVQKWMMQEYLPQRPYLNKPGQSPEVEAAKLTAAYNWGQENVRKFLNKRKAEGLDIYESLDWIEKLPKEPRNYVKGIVLNKLPEFQKQLQRDTINSPYNKLFGYQKGGVLNKLNPKNWGVADYTGKGNFNTAYRSAKKAGEKEFIWNDKRYTTKYAGTPRQEVGAYGVDGRPVNSKDIDNPAQVNLYPVFGKYLPGHISASIGNNETSVDYRPKGNWPFGIGKVENKGEKSFNVYGQDNLTFTDKVANMPTGNFMVEDEFTPSDWNLFINNCADNVCDALGIPRRKGLETPTNALSKIREKYPTLETTGRNQYDYENLVSNIDNRGSSMYLGKGLSHQEFVKAKTQNTLKNINKLLSVYYSPDTKDVYKKEIGLLVQRALENSGYSLPKSNKSDGQLDGIIGKETKQALENWKSKNKMQNGGLLKGQAGLKTSESTGKKKSNFIRDWWYNTDDVQNTYQMANDLDPFVKNWLQHPETLTKLKQNLQDGPLTRDLKANDLILQSVSTLKNTPVFNRELIKNSNITSVDIENNNEIQNWKSPSSFRAYFQAGSGELGRYSPITKQIIVNSFEDLGTLAHEYTHATESLQNAMDKVIDWNYYDKKNSKKQFAKQYGTSNYDPKTNESTVQPSDEVIKKYPELYKNYWLEKEKYLNEDGVYPRIMDIRRSLNLKPGQVVDESILENKSIKNPLEGLRHYYDDDVIIDMLNRLALNANKKSIPTAKNGGIITDSRGQWAHPGKVTRIPSDTITMQGVKQPLLGVSDKGEQKLMMPNKNYKFANAKYVTEYPLKEKGGIMNKLGDTSKNRRDLLKIGIQIPQSTLYPLPFAKGGLMQGRSGIYIKPENRGKFTAWAKSKGMGVQEAASQVMANKEKYSPTIVKRANFAKNAAGWNKADGGQILWGAPQSQKEKILARGGSMAMNYNLGNMNIEPKSYAQGGGMDNPGFKALPDFVQAKIKANMEQGGVMKYRMGGRTKFNKMC